MTLEGDCEQEELSDCQKKYYSNTAKAHELSMLEVEKLKKDASTVSKIGNVCFVKSTYHVKVQNSSIQPAQPKKATPENSTSPQSVVKPNLPPKSMINVTQLTNSPQLKNLQLQTVLKPQTTYGNRLSNVQPASSDAPSITTPACGKKIVTTQIKYLEANTSVPNAPSTSIAIPVTLPKKTVQASEDLKNLTKSVPSLAVVVHPSKSPPESVMQKKREELDVFVKSKLILDPRRFAEWLMQSRLVRSQQSGQCRFHPSSLAEALQLGMYNEEGKFPHSGGYVWISKCCDKNFISIFRESIFENSAHPPTVLLKLIYHWACQTTVNNVILWVKVDRLFLRTFYAMLRSVCTVQVHTTTPVFCANKNGRVEIGVISLGTTSSDGKRRDVKVEVLGVYDQETKKFRLRASEPIDGDSRSRARFARILEPLARWVSPKAMILTDFTVDRATLQDLGFYYIVQKTLSTVTSDDRLNNRTIMEYLRRTVPKVFQNTLSLLSTACIQQFLDELVWRENQGLTSSDAFHNILRDLGTQAQVDTGMPLINRLSMVTVDPFKDWNLDLISKPTGNSAAQNANHATGKLSVAVKRSASLYNDGAAKKPRAASFYSTYTPPQQSSVNTWMDIPAYCQRPGCRIVSKTNLDMMTHLRRHLVNDGKKANNADVIEQCIYCLETFSSVPLKKIHQDSIHRFMSSFDVGPDKEDSATIKHCVCLICLEKFQTHRLLEQHLERTHVACEMPYRCRVCKYQTSVHSQLIDHFYAQHHKSWFLLCPLCLDTFTIESDATCTGFSTGHFQYLAHLKSHANTPSVSRNRCKSCLLTFLHPKQLDYHVQTDHRSMIANLATRPFTYTIQYQLASGKFVSSAAVHPSSSNSSRPAVAPSTTLPLSKNNSSKTPAAKSNLQDIGRDLVPTVSRRYPHFLLKEKSASPSHNCIECNEELKKKNHFPAYMCCPSCRFSTSCAGSMRKHMQDVHQKTAKDNSTPKLGSVFTLSETVKCKCGFTSTSGLDVGRHFTECPCRCITLA